MGGVKVDHARAHEVSLANARAGNIDSAIAVADMYLHGTGCAQSDSEARVWFKRVIAKDATTPRDVMWKNEAARALAKLVSPGDTPPTHHQLPTHTIAPGAGPVRARRP